MSDAPEPYGDDGWLICVACDEEVEALEAVTCDSGEDFCPACWASRAKVEH